jgi:hypothetical protein
MSVDRTKDLMGELTPDRYTLREESDAMRKLQEQLPSNHQLGPREPRNDMVICPECTCQFIAICVADQQERSRMETEIERLRAALAVACERNGGVCAMGTNEAESDPCTPENCSTMRAVETCKHFTEHAVGQRIAESSTRPFECPYCTVERLRTENEVWRKEVTSTIGDNEILYASQERVRAALEKLTNGYKYSTEVVTIAREALAEAPAEASECNDPEHLEAMRHLSAVMDTEAECDRLRAGLDQWHNTALDYWGRIEEAQKCLKTAFGGQTDEGAAVETETAHG